MRRVLLAAALAALMVVPAAYGWTWPTDGPVLRPFSLGDDPYAGGQHRGVDVGGELGSDVRAPAAGTVSFTGFVPGGGKTVTIQTADGYAVTLLQLGEILVMKGALVDEGAVVARIGESTDAVTAQPHVHLGIRVAADPQGYVDPLTLLPLQAAPVEEPEAPAEVAEPVDTAEETTTPPVEAPASEPAPVAAEPSPAPAAPEPAPPAPVVEEPATTAEPAEPPVAQPEAPPVEEAAAPLAAEAYPAPHALERLPLRAASTVERRPTAKPQHPRRAGRIRPEAVHATPKPALASPAAAAPSRRAESHPVATAPTAILASRAAHRPRESSSTWLVAVLGTAVASAAGLAVGARRAGRRARPIMGSNGSERRTEDPRRRGLAVRERAAAHRSRGGLRRPVRHLRALPPAEGQRRPDGERDGRARDAGDGGRRQRGTLAA